MKKLMFPFLRLRGRFSDRTTGPALTGLWHVIASALLAGWLLAATGCQDPHDAIVYGRYRRTVVPGKIDTIGAEYWRRREAPATQQDVAEGEAVFTFEGLGRARVHPLPKKSLQAVWTTLKDFSYQRSDGTTEYENTGWVCQAEELLIDGKWKPYFGFVCEKGMGVAPASEVDLWFPKDKTSGIHWLHLPGGVDWGAVSPNTPLRNVHMGLNVGEPLPVTVYIRNRRGVPRKMPSILYRDTGDGRALRKGVRVCLEYAPFDPNCPDVRSPHERYPYGDDFQLVEPKARRPFEAADPGRVLKSGEIFKAFTLDLRDWFTMDKPGYYRFHFEFDPYDMAMPRDLYQGPVPVSIPLTLGKPPKPPTIAEVNRRIKPFGGADNEKRLRELIKRTSVPVTRATYVPKGKGPGPFKWSKAVNGVSARVEDAGWIDYQGYPVLLRLKNVSDKPIRVPTANPPDKAKGVLFELHTADSEGRWQHVRKVMRPRIVAGPRFEPGAYTGEMSPSFPDAPSLQLKAGQSAVVYVEYGDHENTAEASEMKIILRQPLEKEGLWRGTLETAAFPANPERDFMEKYAHTLVFPDYWPHFSRDRTGGLNWSGSEPQVECIDHANWHLLWIARWLYKPGPLRKELERRMRTEKDIHMQLFLASIAAPEGSEAAAIFLMETLKRQRTKKEIDMRLLAASKAAPEGSEESVQLFTKALKRETNFEIIMSACQALSSTKWEYEGNSNRPPGWLVALGELTKCDERYVTGIEDVSRFEPMYTIAYIAMTRVGVNGASEGKWEIPDFVKEISRKYWRKRLPEVLYSPNQYDIGELVELLEWSLTKLTWSRERPPMDEFWEVLGALVELRAREAVPILVKHLELMGVIDALRDIGDPQAVPALEALVRRRGKIVKNGRPVEPRLEEYRLYEARVALACLAPNWGARLGKLLLDRSLDPTERSNVLTYLYNQGLYRGGIDPGCIPYLVKAIRSDPDPCVVGWAITTLGNIRHKAAVDALIQCLDVDFSGREKKPDIKGGRRDPHRDKVVEKLQHLTDQNLEADKKQWQAWWIKNRDTIEGLE